MECKIEHFRHILLFYFRKGKNATQATKKLFNVYSDKSLKDRQCRNWCDKFRSGDFLLKDEQRSGLPNKVDDGGIKVIIGSGRHVTVREIEEMLKIPRSTIDCHIYFVKKVPGIYHSKRPLKEIMKNLFDAKLAPLSSILTWSSSAICHLVCSQCSMSVYLKCLSRFFQWIRISNKEFVSNFALQMEFRVRNR